ncbi:11248_t:CDS:10 [Acaulospora morrowiae]|uniref:11248_t:CDS:1 n=1 Tax=Acaulospora morrowiae TaxID=94023 RepID=A0A9N8VMP8_9GLOM|nr:11248_t:CDS:10 [Acaulospora morrowiae]
MNLPTVLLQVEEACADMQVPSTRHAGEQVMLSFKQMSGNLEACQYVLVSYGISGEGFGDSGLRILLERLFIKSEELASFVYAKQFYRMMPYVQNQILHTVSVMIKRGLEDYHDAEKHSILTDIKSTDGHSQLVGVGLANALVDEFSSTKASNVGLPWNFHKKCKDFFEATYLLPIFDHVLRILHQRLQMHTTNGIQYSQPYANGHQIGVATSIPHHDLSHDSLLAMSLNLAEKILCWDFVSNNESLLAGTFSKDENDIIEDELFITTRTREFPASWRGHMMHDEVLRLFFRLYKAVQKNEQLANRCRQCLIQISGLHGVIFESEQQIIDYVVIMKHEILELINNLSSNITERLASAEYGPSLLGISQMTRRLLCTISLPTLCKVPDFSNFLHEIAQLSATCLRESAMVKDGYGYLIEDSTWSLEAFDEFLAVWVKLAQDAQSYQSLHEHQQSPSFNPAGFIAFLGEASYHIAATYIDTRLEMARCSSDDDEEANNFKDWVTYEDQLISIAILARMVGQRVLDKLQVLLHERAAQLRAFFMAVADNSAGFAADCTIMYLQESIHWLVLISAFVLADAGEGEQPLVPDALMKLSISQCNLGKNHDQIVLLVNTISGILDLVSLDTSAVETSHCSPRVAETLFWFFERWGKTYLLIDESDYSSISDNVVRAFGKPESRGEGQHILNYLIGKIKVNFILWNSDPGPLSQIERLLNSYGKKTSLRNGLLKSSNFSDLLTFFTGNLDHFPQIIHNSLIQTIAIITSGASDEELRHHYFQMITGAIEKRFLAVLQRPDFENVYQQADVMAEVLNALEMFDGLALASDIANSELICSFCSKYFEFMVKLLHYYQNCPEVGLLVLQFFDSFVSYQDLGSLSTDQAKFVYQIIANLFKSYASVNFGRKRLLSSEEAEEEPYADISIILNILSGLMASEFREYLYDDAQENKTATEFDIPSVVLYGVDFIIPTINTNMFKIPKLCKEYMRFVSYLVEFYPDKLEGLSADSQRNLYASLELLHIILECFLFKDFEADLLEPASAALVALICARRESYNTLVQTLISQQTSPEIQNRLHDAFSILSGAIPQTLPEVIIRRREVSGFREVLFRFLMDVRGFLRVK